MSVATQPHPALRWDGRRLAVLDQTRLPAAEVWLALEGAADTAQAIRRLAVRGAPLIGVAAAYGLAMEVARQPGLGTLETGWELLRAARPTAVNLAYAVDRVRAAALAAGPARWPRAARAEAERIHAEEDAASAAIAAPRRRAAGRRARIATHCNTGALAAGGQGTALAVILALHERGARARARLRDAAAAAGRAADRVGAGARRRRPRARGRRRDGRAASAAARSTPSIVGCDRVAANGDTANKVGTYPLALAARAAGIPFVVAGPTSTIDAALPDGDGIEIEERDGDEVRAFGGAHDDAAGHRRAQPGLRRHPGRAGQRAGHRARASRGRRTPRRIAALLA